MFATMTSKGQVTLPKAIRNQLALATGDRLLLTVVDGRLVGIPQNRDFASLAGMLGDPPNGPATFAEIDKAIGDAVAEHVTGRGIVATKGAAA